MRLRPVQLLLSLLLMLSPIAAHADAFNDPGARAGGKGVAAAGDSDLTPVKPAIDGGQITVGATSQVVALFRNDSGHPLTIGAIQLYPSSTVSADVTLNQCSDQQLEASAVCAVSMSVKGLSAGAWRVEMLIRHSGRARLATAAATGTVVAGQGQQGKFLSDIEAIPDKLDFGDVTSSQPIIRSIVLRNSSSIPLDITSVYIESADKAGFSVKTDCSRVVPGQACIAVVTWSPVLGGQASGTLVIDHSGPTKVASVDMAGKFTPANSSEATAFPQAVPGKGLLVSSQKEIDFGTGIDSTSSITVSLVNVGDAPLTLKDIRLDSNDDGLSIAKSGCATDTTLDPVDACPLTLTWTPSREGAILDDVQITHDGTRGILILPVRGAANNAVSQDSKAVHLAGGAAAGTLEPQTSIAPSQPASRNQIDPATVLDSFTVTSHASTRAIISGPGGSRIVFDGQEVVLGGNIWKVHVRPSGVEFAGTNKEKVLLLFDRSLAAVGARTSSSSSGGAMSAASSAPRARPPSPASPAVHPHPPPVRQEPGTRS